MPAFMIFNLRFYEHRHPIISRAPHSLNMETRLPCHHKAVRILQATLPVRAAYITKKNGQRKMSVQVLRKRIQHKHWLWVAFNS